MSAHALVASVVLVTLGEANVSAGEPEGVRQAASPAEITDGVYLTAWSHRAAPVEILFNAAAERQ